VSDVRSMRSGAEILRDLDDASRGVQQASTKLSQLVTRFGDTKIRYETAIGEELLRIYEEAVQDGRRVPPTDLRAALAEKAVRTKSPDLFALYSEQKTQIEALKLWLSNQRQVISGYQSLRRGEAT